MTVRRARDNRRRHHSPARATHERARAGRRGRLRLRLHRAWGRAYVASDAHAHDPGLALRARHLRRRRRGHRGGRFGRPAHPGGLHARGDGGGRDGRVT